MNKFNADFQYFFRHSPHPSSISRFLNTSLRSVYCCFNNFRTQQYPEIMKNVKDKTKEPLNSNEIISDYDFHVQLIVEEKALDFEKDKNRKKAPV